ncbi:peroxisomal biogenesis factor 11 [Aspergillus ambiguus]|uniref:peroxisomal biogenesis factor 11 n=1 Tax=Aspergillus ambiguus TaxID=176160 RepID=UPI003CCCB6CD
MAHATVVYSRPSLLKQLVNFTSVTAGLEKTLRLIQALALIAAEVSLDHVTATRCSIAMSQLALGRRYFRLLDFYGCFEHAYDLLTGNGPSKGAILTMMELVEFSSLGLYCALENLTILHDMNILLVSWYTPLLMEANKFWFYAICLSLARAICELAFLDSTAQKQHSGPEQKEKIDAVDPHPTPSATAILKRMVVDGCDLTLPGSFIGWTPVGDLGVGIAMVISTVVASQDIWARAQQ